MAKNKKPRKKYRPKVAHCTVFTEKDKADYFEMLDMCEFRIRNAFHFGNATGENLEETRCIMNAALAGLESRDYLTPEEVEACKTAIYDGAQSLYNVIDRYNKGKSDRFIFTANELKLLAYGYTCATTFIKDSMEREPLRTMKEYFAARVIDRWGVYPVTPKMINQVIDRFACKPLLEWR